MRDPEQPDADVESEYDRENANYISRGQGDPVARIHVWMLSQTCASREFGARPLLSHQLRLPCPDRAVTLARRILEPGTVHHRDVAPPVCDETRFLESPHRDRHSRPPYAEHRRQEFLRQIEAVAADTIMRHEQPTRAPLLDHVKTIARRRLRNGLEHELAVAVEQAIKVRTRGDQPRISVS